MSQQGVLMSKAFVMSKPPPLRWRANGPPLTSPIGCRLADPWSCRVWLM